MFLRLTSPARISLPRISYASRRDRALRAAACARTALTAKCTSWVHHQDMGESATVRGACHVLRLHWGSVPIVNTVFETAFHISHEAISRWEARVVRRLGRARYLPGTPAHYLWSR